MKNLQYIFKTNRLYKPLTDSRNRIIGVLAYGKKWRGKTPLFVELAMYRKYIDLNSHNPQKAYKHLKRAHDFLWPNDVKTWHYWTERRFKAHCQNWNTISLAGGANIGKAQPLFCKILTPLGWKTMAEIEIGDEVCTPSGDIANVINIHEQKERRCLKFHFSDGSSTYCDEQHLWSMIPRIGNEFYDVEVLEAKEIQRRFLNQKRFVLPYYKAAHFDHDGIHAIEPSVLAEYLFWPKKLEAIYDPNDKFQLQRLGIFETEFKDRFIPREYLTSSYDARLELFKAIISHRPKLKFHNKQLCLDFIELSRSLAISVKYVHLDGKHYAISGPKFRELIKIEPVGEHLTQCISIDTIEQLYITDDYIPTHNSVDMAKLALIFWLANPQQHTILVGSTSITDLDNRIWGYIKKYYSNANVEMPGKLFTSAPPKILFDTSKLDTIHGMFAVALQKGTSKKAASTLIGRHPEKGMLVIIDEATDVNPGFIEAKSNWEKSPWFQMIVIGNSCSAFDPHGILSTPLDGWDRIDPDHDTQWETKEGVCLYFDCYDSPAIKARSTEKKTLLGQFLFTEKSIQKDIDKYGEKSHRFWRFTRGFWPLEDQAKTILTPIMIDKFKVKTRAHWSGTKQQYRLAGLDPAFTLDGDNCVLRFATLSLDIRGKWVLDYGGEDNVYLIRLDAESSEPVEYQIVDRTITLCRQAGVKPQDLAVDVAGPGTGLGAIFEQMWSRHVYKVKSVGKPSSSYIDFELKDTAKDAYDRRVTELWFSMRKFVLANQIRGLDEEAIKQFCTRAYTWKGKKLSIETKEEYKARLGKIDDRYMSPDQADAAVLILDLARQHYQFIPEKAASPQYKREDFKYSPEDLMLTRYVQQLAQEQKAKYTETDIFSDGFLEADDFGFDEME